MMALSECLALAKKHVTEGLQARKEAIQKTSLSQYFENVPRFLGIDLQVTLMRDQVPMPLREPGIPGGYRVPYQPWTYYIKSIFHLHNETVNVWTHIIGIFLIISSMFNYSQILDFTNDVAWPFLIFGICCILSCLGSSIAHMIHSKSVYAHYVAFSFDYAGAGLYCFVTNMMIMYYSADEGVISKYGSYLMPMNTLFGLATCFGCSYGKAKYSLHHRLQKMAWFVTPTASHFLFSVAPALWRFLKPVSDDVIISPAEVESWRLHLMYLGAFLASVFFYLSHIPEIFWPGRFDTLGHGHQMWHVLFITTILLQFETAYHDITHRPRRQEVLSQLPPSGHLFLYTAVLILAQVFLLAFIRRLARAEVDKTNLEYKWEPNLCQAQKKNQ